MLTKFVSLGIFLARVQQQNWINCPPWTIDGLNLDFQGSMDDITKQYLSSHVPDIVAEKMVFHCADGNLWKD
jgi:hypothetical protein